AERIAGAPLAAAAGLVASVGDAAASEAIRPVEARDNPKRDGVEPPRSRELAHLPAEPRIERSGDEAAARKLPFWKRIALPRAQPAPAAATPRSEPSRSVSLEPVLSGLAALEKQLVAHQSATEAQLRRFEDNLTRLWEVEDQMALTEVRERLALLEANQQEIADGLHSVGRNLVLLAVVLATAVAGGLLAVGLLL
ncbi:MAG TPA: hypothetical protein VJP77_02780, partial [Planctomycetota bacterium]|nr:hypothetical protein [Planctomycetota bacterium]